MARGRGYTLLLSGSGATLKLNHRSPIPALIAARSGRQPAALSNRTGTVSIRFLGANNSAQIEGLDRLRGISNYLLGRDRSKWRKRIPTYAQVRCRALYPRVDLVYYGTQGQLEYDVVVAPHGDPGLIRFAVEDGARLELNRAGDLAIKSGDAQVTLCKPVIYQETAAGRRAIDGRFRQLGPSTIGFEVAAYDHHRLLVIDPVLVYSSYLGGLSAYDRGIAIDSSGGVYITGWTDLKDDLPTRSPNGGGPYQPDLNPGGAAGVSTPLSPRSTPRCRVTVR